MRIIAGSAKGRTLEGPGPKGKGIRPTADRVRETLFNILGQFLDGGTVLDLYAGTGALGLEALSRGARKAVLVDSDREAVRLCQQNAQGLGFEAQVEVLAQAVERALPRLGQEGRRFEWVFADPPYGAKALMQILQGVVAAGVLAPGGTLLVEHDKREEAPEAHGPLTRTDQRRFGDTVVSFYTSP